VYGSAVVGLFGSAMSYCSIICGVCVCGSYHCGVILLCDLVQLCVSWVAFVSGVSVDGSDLIKLWVQIRFSARFGLSV